MEHLVAVCRMNTSIPVTTILLIIITTVQQLGGAHGNSPGSHTPGEFKGLYGPSLTSWWVTYAYGHLCISYTFYWVQ